MPINCPKDEYLLYYSGYPVSSVDFVCVCSSAYMSQLSWYNLWYLYTRLGIFSQCPFD